MIKRILLALDPDPDTPVATKFAIRLAKRFDASVTGLAVVDTRNLQTSIPDRGIGYSFSGDDLWERLTDETRRVATGLLQNFKDRVEKQDVKHTAVKKEGASFERIIEEMKYHDLLIAGRDSHFFYNEPDKETDTLAQVVKNGVSPTLVVTDEYKDVEKVIVAFDGSAPAARSMQSYVHLLPYGKDVEIELLAVSSGKSGDNGETAQLILNNAAAYLKDHNFNYITNKVLEKGKPSQRILERQQESNPDLIILGAHAVSAVRRLTFGSTTHDLITKTETPLFLSP